ncbi:MAG: RICIN domain-containing protein [Hamadaea sp.]|uniref:RICIN domain-containing protein n=1 Tax=Hamadaea sp. TaxID=2024425 RepID=UPI00183FE61C|nr:RICIN domain-containing protein [Hamadaea sp.]NUT22466.1 RICIN domain-containing protein [Hamadaea sp.]
MSIALTVCVGLAIASLIHASPASALTPPYLLQSQDSRYKLCLEVAYASTDNGARIQQWPCDSGPAQLWYPIDKVVVDGVSYYGLLNANSSAGQPMCLEVPWGSPNAGQALQLWDCLGAARQLWSMDFVSGTDYRTLENLQTKQCAEIPWNTPTAGAVVQQWPCYGGEAQHWRFQMPAPIR